MPYFIDFKYPDGLVSRFGPVVPDNPKSEHGFEDSSIKKSCNNFVRFNNKQKDGVVCEVVHLST